MAPIKRNIKRSLCLLIVTISIALLLPLPSAGEDFVAREYKTRSGKSLLIEERHPAGQSLSDISLQSTGFDHDLSEVLKDRDPIQSVHVADLDSNGFDEFYIITVSSGSGSYGNVIGFGSNRDKSLSMIYFPEIQEGDELFNGYMGHDAFSIDENRLVRSFPVYQPSDTNNKPTGGTRRLIYDLFPGEAAWQLRIIEH
jgi:hypothetical protein